MPSQSITLCVREISIYERKRKEKKELMKKDKKKMKKRM